MKKKCSNNRKRGNKYMKFTKMHGLGNDYVYVNGFIEKVSEPGVVARFVSDRHKGIGSDGLILIEPSSKADFRMRMYNADGSVGEMCGNGIRCLGKYVYERGLTSQKEIRIETAAGIRTLYLTEEGGEITLVKVDMGSPMLRAEQIPIISDHTKVLNEPIIINRLEYRMTGVSMGNPHAVVYVKSVKGLDMQWIGPRFEYHGRFPRRINAEFVEVIDRSTVRVRVWERGAGETMACGTGACAVVVASVLNDLTDRQVTVKLLGGELFVEWVKETNTVYMTGSAETVFDGEIHVPEAIRD